MVRFPRCASAILTALTAVCTALSSSRATAQDAPSPLADAGMPISDASTLRGDAGARTGDASVSTGDASILLPPELLERSEATYPDAARTARIEGTVVLQLTIDRNGNVTEAEVIEPAGYGFDEAAREAALRFRFAPARRNGEAIPARIRYPYAFTLAPMASDAGVVDDVAPVSSSAPRAAETNRGRTAAPVSSTPTRRREAVDVMVHGALTRAERLQQSAEAVHVIDLGTAHERTADMGAVLARTQGVVIRRQGGLGSDARFSLDGLYDEQVRFFLDGVPLEFSGFPFGLTNIPVNLVQHVEVYRGVVPIRFGADALGGAVNFTSNPQNETRLGASYQVGSFGIHRLTVDGTYHDERSGFIANGAAFFHLAENDYDIDVEIPDERGRLFPATVPRFHDGYSAYAGTLEAGFIDRPWAKRLLLRGFASTYDKELQHNVVMTVPYGEVTYGETSYGATARYEVALRSNVDLEVVGNYAYRIIDFVDKGEWVYDWNGDRIRQRRVPGEIESDPMDQTIREHGVFGRAMAAWRIAPQHTLRVSISPRFTTRTGDERIQADPDARDPLTAQQDLLRIVSGIEYQLDLFDGRLSNIVFVKDYVYRAAAEEPLSGGVFRKKDKDRNRFGFGNALRYRFAPWLYAKVSYEYATRLPGPDEVFGDGLLIVDNLELVPEVSHNANLGPRLELRRTTLGTFTVDINAFLRDSDGLIILLGNDRRFSYQNVYHARGVGLETSSGWVSPRRWISVDMSLTWQDVRNVSTEGTFGDFEGDRIPNRPYLFGSWGIAGRIQNLPGPRDTIEPFYEGRYVHEFFRGWESQGLREFKQVVDAQVTHNVGVSWTLDRDFGNVTTTFEIENVTDAKVFDNFGVQRPARGFFFKLSGEVE